MNSSESGVLFPVKNRYLQQQQAQQHSQQNDIPNNSHSQDKSLLGHQLPKSEYPDPEVEETIKRLTAQTQQEVRKFPEKLPHETDEQYQKRIIQLTTAGTINIKQPPLHETFELSIEELDNASVNQLLFQQSAGGGSSTSIGTASPTVAKKQRHIYESPEARARRLARNAERMRERRSNESEDEYRIRLAKMAAASRLRRQNESDMERTMRHVRDAARQRLRRAMESTDQRSIRLAKLAARAKYMRQNETPDQRSERLRKLAQHHRERYNRQKEAQKNGEPLKDSRKTAASSGTFLSSSSSTDGHASTSKVHGAQSSNQTFPVGQAPSTSSSGASHVGPPAAHQFHEFDQAYPPYHLFRTNAFPELPPHLNPQSRAAAAAAAIGDATSSGTTATGMYSSPGHLTNLQDLSQHLVNQYQHAKIIQQANAPSAQYSTMCSTNVPPIQVPNPQQIYRPSSGTAAQQISTTSYTTQNQQPGQTPFVRGRPVKIFPSNDYRNISPSLKDEADRQHTLNEMLEAHINNMLTSPKQSRGRPYRGRETNGDRSERLRKMADSRRAQRDKETPDERSARLRDLAERARKRREITLQTENDEERRLRLQKQAEYARKRRQNNQTPIALKIAEERAKHLYTKLHEKPTTTISLSHQTSTGKVKNWTNYGNRK